MLAAVESNNSEVVVSFQRPFSKECHKIVHINYLKLIKQIKTGKNKINKTLIGTTERSVV